MTINEDREALAAEYALGTLNAQERAHAEAMMETDAPFATLVHAWEKKLGALHETIEPVEPPAHLWPRILARLDGGEVTVTQSGADIVDLTRKLRRWRGMSAATGALAACLVLFVGLQQFAPAWLPEFLRPAEPGGRYVAVLQQGGMSQGFILTVDLKTKSFTVRRAGATPPPEHSFELWLVHGKFPGPRSLGVIGEGEYTTKPTLAAYDAATINEATFAVSVEPHGGSPTGAPTGPVVFQGKLVEAEP